MATTNPSFSALAFRHPAPGDAARVLELMIRRDVAEATEVGERTR